MKAAVTGATTGGQPGSGRRGTVLAVRPSWSHGDLFFDDTIATLISKCRGRRGTMECGCCFRRHAQACCLLPSGICRNRPRRSPRMSIAPLFAFTRITNGQPPSVSIPACRCRGSSRRRWLRAWLSPPRPSARPMPTFPRCRQRCRQDCRTSHSDARSVASCGYRPAKCTGMSPITGFRWPGSDEKSCWRKRAATNPSPCGCFIR